MRHGRLVRALPSAVLAALYFYPVYAQQSFDPGERIIGGVLTTIEKHPWQVAMYINLRTAKTLGLDVPLSLTGRADEVFE